MTQRISLRRPDDWHLHLRDGAMLEAVLPETARHFARAIILPNLVPPVVTGAEAAAYRDALVFAVVALILVPVAFGLFAGAGLSISDMITDGIKDLAPTAAMLFFAIIFFGIMIDVGLFDPLIRVITRFLGDDPAKIVLGTAILAGDLLGLEPRRIQAGERRELHLANRRLLCVVTPLADVALVGGHVEGL